MAKLANQLRALRLFNNYDLLKRFGHPGDVAIEYHRPAARSVAPNATRVWSPYPHPALSEPDYGTVSRRFLGLRRETWQLAVNWSMEQFGHDYVPSPFGGYLPDHIVHKARYAAEHWNMLEGQRR